MCAKFPACLMIWPVILFAATSDAEGGYLTRQLTTTAGKVEDHIRISGSRAVWQRKFGSDYEIYAYDGANVLQLTNNGTDDTNPEISGDRVVYLDATDVLCYDFATGTTSNLSNDAGWQQDPRIDGDWVYWFEWDAVDLNKELIRMNLSTGNRTNISDNTRNNQWNSESNFSIAANRAAWIALNGSSSEILFNDGSTTVTLGNDPAKTYSEARVTESLVLWHESSTAGNYIAVYDGSTTSRVDVTANPTGNLAVGPSGICLTRSFAGATEGSTQLDLFVLDPSTLAITTLASSPNHEDYPGVGDGVVAWVEGPAPGLNDTQIKAHDLLADTTETVSVAGWVNEYTRISGRNIVWRGYDFDISGEIEVFIAYWLGEGAVLTGLDLAGEDLSGHLFTGADLRGADLSGAVHDAGALAGAWIDADTLFPDGGDFTTTTHDLTGIELPSAFRDWMAGLGLADADGLEDSDGDGQANLLEFALGGDAADAAVLPVVRGGVEGSAADGISEFQYLFAARRGAVFGAVGSGALGADIDGIGYRVEGSGNLADYWEDLNFIGHSDTAPAGSGLPDLSGTAWEYVRFRFASPPSSGKGFMRVVVTME